MSDISASLPPAAAPPMYTVQKPQLKPPRFRAARTIFAMILREMGSTYGRQPGGYIWAVASPVCSIIVMALIFSLLVRAPALGTSFVMFYATGMLPFGIYQQISSKAGSALSYSRPLLAYPGVTWMDAIIARCILTMLTSITVSCIVMVGTMAIVDTRTILDIRPIVTGVLLMTVIGIGVGVMNCLLRTHFAIWDRVWSIISQPMFLASGIFFLYDEMPKFLQDILWWNPIAHGVAWVRTGFYSTYHAAWVSLPYAFGVGTVLMALALVFLRHGYRATLER